MSESYSGNAERTIDYGKRGHVLVVADGNALARKAAETLASAIDGVAGQGREALVALSGGSTPKQMGSLLREAPFAGAVPWDRVHMFWGDERAVPLEDPESNAGEALRRFIDAVGVPSSHVHTWDSEADDLEAAAEAYAATIREVGGVDLPIFDLVFLGMGDDGHTLSLFPHTSAIRQAATLTATNRVDKLDTTRLTMTAPLVNNAAVIVFLVGGSGKAETLHAVLDGDTDVDTYPSQIIRPTHGRLVWVIDEAAAAHLQRETTSHEHE